ncbi:AP-4 complex subunit mu [Diplonema papillatum]|nr:AP-4 complex subunit mu [Diplonema papillatum]
MPISQIFALSPRGDKIIAKDYRSDIVRGTDEIFFRKYKFWDGPGGGDTPPFFTIDGINYAYVKKNNLLLVITTRENMSPSLLAEILIRLTKLLKDFLGVLNEESLRKNFVMVYEILDEVIDYGIPQGMSSEKLKPYIFNEPLMVESDEKKVTAVTSITNMKTPFPRPFSKGTKKATEAQASILGGDNGARSNEIYVDVLERLNTVFNANGHVVTSEIDGAIIMKSFLTGTPELRLGLNEDLTVGRNERSYGGVVLDSVNFHECINYSDFESERTLFFRPPDGEFVAMNYRVTGIDYAMPFRINPTIEYVSPYKVELTLQVRADFPGHIQGTTVLIKFAVPKVTNSVAVDFRGGSQNQTYEYKSADKVVVWLIKQFNGSTEQVCKARISFSQPTTQAIRREIGPISMNFEIPMYIVSGLNIRFLKIEERSKSYNPARWVRNITQANSYICRIN